MISLIYFLLIFPLIGLAAGWIASQVMGGGGSLLKMMLLGVVGSFLGGFLIRVLGFSKQGGLIAEVITAAIGAVVFVFLLRKFGRVK